MAGAIVVFLYVGFTTDITIIPLFISLLFLYIVIYSGSSYYGIFKVIKVLKKRGIQYDIKKIKALISQEPINVRTIYRSSAEIQVSSQENEALVIHTTSFFIVLAWYKEIGAYKKLSKPLLIESSIMEDSLLKGSLKRFRKVRKEEITYCGKSLLIALSKTKKDFKQILLVDFLDSFQKE
jgi:hypothetical protein